MNREAAPWACPFTASSAGKSVRSTGTLPKRAGSSFLQAKKMPHQDRSATTAKNSRAPTNGVQLSIASGGHYLDPRDAIFAQLFIDSE